MSSAGVRGCGGNIISSAAMRRLNNGSFMGCGNNNITKVVV